METNKLREELAKLCGKRRRFEGVFERFGQKSGYKDVLTTILLSAVKDMFSGTVVTDHLWFTMGKRFEALKLTKGDVVRFDARVTSYEKGYMGRQDEDAYDFKPVETDYRLSFPSKFIKVSTTAPNPLVTCGEV